MFKDLPQGETQYEKGQAVLVEAPLVTDREQILALADECGIHPNPFTECTERFYHAARKPLEAEIERLKQYEGYAEACSEMIPGTGLLAVKIKRIQEQLTAANARISELEAQGEPVGTIIHWEPLQGILRVQQERLANGYHTPKIGAKLYLRAPQAVPLTIKVVDMHESNGRVTWSVFLAKSPDDVLWDCHQVYSDSIEGRARYEAAVLSHFLGTGPAPDILAFDTDAPAQQAVRWHVGDSHFEDWFQSYNMAGKGTKQLCRDAYAAGMGESAPQAVPEDGRKGFSIYLGREDWGHVIDGLMLERQRSEQRKSANPDSNSNYIADRCAGLIGKINTASAEAMAAAPSPEGAIK